MLEDEDLLIRAFRKEHAENGEAANALKSCKSAA